MPPLHPASLREPPTLPADPRKFAEDQRACPTLKAWHQLASSGPPSVHNKGSKSPQYLYLKGLLYQRTMPRGQECLRLCVPQCRRPSIISWAHHDPQHGHQGPADTLEKLKKSYVWPYLHAEVSSYCRSCLSCQTMALQSPPRPPTGPSKRPAPTRRYPPHYSQAPPHKVKPWAGSPCQTPWALRAPRGPRSSAFQVPPARHPMATYAPSRRSHYCPLPRALGAPPAHLQALPPYLRRT